MKIPAWIVWDEQRRQMGGGATQEHVIRACCHPITGEVPLPPDPPPGEVVNRGDFRRGVEIIHTWTVKP